MTGGDTHDLDDVLAEYHDRKAKGESVDPEEYFVRHPELRAELELHFQTLGELDQLALADPAYPAHNQHIGGYRLIRLLGRGSMGVVYLAEQVATGRTFALKVLGSALTQSEASLERFRREARSAQKLRHPNLIAVHDHGESQGYSYYAMDHVEGVTLAQILNRLRQLHADGIADPSFVRVVEELVGKPASGEAVPNEGRFVTIARIVKKVAEALAIAHAAGIVHRDVKPQNILVQADLEPRLGDFGLAKDAAFESLSRSGLSVGTPYYMSPEMVRAKGTKVDHRTDVYSLGATLYELLTLGVPFAGGSIDELFLKITVEAPPTPAAKDRTIPRPLQAIALRALEKRPDDRYSGCDEMAADLARFLDGQEVLARMPSLVRRGAERLRRHATAIALASACLGGAALAILYGHPAIASGSQLVVLPAAEDGAAVSLRLLRLGELAEPAVERVEGTFRRQLAAGDWLVTTLAADGKLRERQVTIPRDGGSVEVDLGAAFAASTPRPGMVRIAAGSYVIGFDPPPPARTFARVETTVTVAAFDIDRCEVSNEEYLEFVLAGPNRRRPWKDGKFAADEGRHPVSDVTFDEAKAYAEWRGKRLPTDVEWEVAGRGPAHLAYPWGNQFSVAAPNANLGHPIRTNDVAAEQPGTPCDVDLDVGDRSWCGVLHLVGNVREWVADPWTPRTARDGKGEQPESAALLGPGDRTLRGASFLWAPSSSSCRLSERRPEHGTHPSEPSLGFRCANSAPWQ